MTIRQKYASLSNQHFLKQMVVTSVYNSMQLEGQTVSKEKLVKLYIQVQKEKGEKGKVIPK